jgi:7-cyano-7-deazaguanine reductase
MDNLTQIASKHLGQQGSYAITTETFDPSFLVPMPRSLARESWGIDSTKFVGYDVWHCHESTFLLDNGVPVAGTLKIVCPANSENMVESKSFKLYLNTFDMCKMGSTYESAIENYEKQVAHDISECIGAPVSVRFHEENTEDIGDPAQYFESLESKLGKDYLQQVQISDYEGNTTHFRVVPENGIEDTIAVYTNVLRSRCRHTKQKDTGAAYFLITTKDTKVDLFSLLKEVVALREVNEFHEFCAEKLFHTIVTTPGVTDCTVMLLYSRRGSLDINPVRSTHFSLIPPQLVSHHTCTKKAFGQ